MKQIVIYQTEKTIWYCERSYREQRKYDNNIFPMRLLVTLASNDFLEELKSLEQYDLIDILSNELWDQQTIYSN